MKDNERNSPKTPEGWVVISEGKTRYGDQALNVPLRRWVEAESEREVTDFYRVIRHES